MYHIINMTHGVVNNELIRPLTQIHNYHIAWKIWWGIKSGSLAVSCPTAKLKPANISYSHIYVYGMAIPYRAAKFNTVVWGSTIKFNSCQYFREYGRMGQDTTTCTAASKLTKTHLTRVLYPLITRTCT